MLDDFLVRGVLAGLGVAAYALNWGGVQDHLTAVQPEIVRAAWVLALAVGLVAIGAQHGRIRSWAALIAPTARPAGSPKPTSRPPVFLVGFPRSGTTLLEQLLAEPA